jgi:hypothetical protein
MWTRQQAGFVKFQVIWEIPKIKTKTWGPYRYLLVTYKIFTTKKYSKTG